MRAGLLRLLAVILVSSAAAGCGAIIDRYDDRIVFMNRSLDTSRNEMILLNILRASYGHPLTFVSVTSVGGSQNAGASAGLPTFTIGPGQVISQKQFVFGNNSVNGGLNSNVNIVPLESKEFYLGLLQPVSLNVAQFFINQGYPRQILYHLFVESIRIKNGSKDEMIYNDPLDPRYALFTDFVLQASKYGLTIETITDAKDPKVSTERLCFDSGVASESLNGFSPICYRNNRTTGANVIRLIDPSNKSASFQINLRSTYAIFRFLGKLVDPQVGATVRLSQDHLGGLGRSEDDRLFPINNTILTDCVASATYLGNYACLPARGAEHGGVIMQLMTQLLALNVSLKDLPIVQSVRITN
jgi:hypothetical protein